MDAEGLDAVIFPTQSDVGPADADVNPASADIAWRNGVWVSNGNLVPRHLGIPTVTVPMGTMADTRMPVGLTLAGPAYSDTRLVQLAQAITALGERRTTPPRTPALPDEAAFAEPRPAAEGELSVTVDEVSRDGGRVTVSATVSGGVAVDHALFVDGVRVPARLENGRVTADAAPRAVRRARERMDRPLRPAGRGRRARCRGCRRGRRRHGIRLSPVTPESPEEHTVTETAPTPVFDYFSQVDLPTPTLSDDEVQRLFADTFGVEIDVQALGSQQDQNFRVFARGSTDPLAY